MAKGKWAQGIKPRHFCWVIDGRLAICERPGGNGANHRRVRRQEEIIWIRENGFDHVISLIPSNHNLHSYDELGVAWKHWPLTPSLDWHDAFAKIFPELQRLLSSGSRLLLHGEDVSDRMAGLLAGYLLWSSMVPAPTQAVVIVERILARQIGPEGRSLVAIASEVAKAGDVAGANDVAESAAEAPGSSA